MFREGQQLGDYRLIRELGRGGFGQVWQAENENGYYAVKLPYKERVDWKQITQEIGLWVLCGKHPNLVPIIEAKNLHGQILIVSEYFPDGSLEDFLGDDGSLSAIEAVEMTTRILEGLNHLHQNGIVHRDLKPANILLDGKTPRLTDFGVSRFLEEGAPSGSIAGTLPYMAPESFEGKRNIQTDIWSVGVILYRLSSGKLPFPQLPRQSLPEQIGAIITNEPEQLPDSVPVTLQNVVSKTLMKDRTLRYRTVSEVREDLENVFNDFSQDDTIRLENISEIITGES